MVRAEEEEDVLQLQTMLAILRFTHLDTMEALYWLARQSRVYQTAIYFAYHEYPSDPELALNRLKDKSSLPEFQQICERLLSTISQVTIEKRSLIWSPSGIRCSASVRWCKTTHWSARDVNAHPLAVPL